MENKNLEAAIEHVLDSTDLSIRPIAKDDDGPADKQVLIRTTESDRERWKKAADASGETLSSWIRAILNKHASMALECTHPLEMIKKYPWSEICKKCGKRLK